MLKKIILTFLLPLFMAVTIAAQTETVSGVVRDITGEVLPGAAIFVKGSGTGTVTDLDGRYVINASKGDILEFSFIGMRVKEVEVGVSSIVDVVLEDDPTLLEEAVSIGYGTQSRSLVTNSIAKVGSEEFEQTPNQNALAQLQGKVPGLTLQVNSGQPGSAPQVFLRGGTTSSPENDTPLIIIDGVISDGTRGLQDMNPADIESMEVLKDAASTAIYGARAANGIIIVKTRSGSKGDAKINFRYTFGLDEQPAKLDLLSASEYVYLTRRNTMLFNKDEYTYTGTSDPDKFLSGGTWGMTTGWDRNSAGTLTFLDDYLSAYGQDYVADLLENQGWETMIDPVTGRRLIFQNNDYQAASFQLAGKHDFDMNISGGTDKFSYYAGIRYMTQEGILRGTDYKNYGVVFKGSHQVKKNLRIDTKATLNVGRSNSVENVTNSLTRAIATPPTYRLYYEDGTPAPGEGMSSFRSRIYEIYYRDNYTDNKNYLANFQVAADWEIIKGLHFQPAVYYTGTQSIANRFEALNETTGTDIRPASASSNRTDHIQVDATLSYSKEIGKNNISAVVGGSYNYDDVMTFSASGSGAPTDFIPTLNASADSTQRASTVIAKEAMLSGFARVNYAWDGKYLASVSLRADGSSKFAENHKWGFFPGASLGWNLHKESFFEPIRKVVNKIKIRASWGRAGNNDLSLANSQGLYAVTGTTYLNNVGILNTTLKNADLVWETTESYDVGLDLGLFEDRIGMVLDVYTKYTYDRLYDMSLWNSTGYSSVKFNYGVFRTTGFEIAFNTVPVSTRDFTWNLDFNFAWYRSIAVTLPDNGEEKNRIGGNYIYDANAGEVVKVGGLAEGERFGTRYAVHYLGVYQTEEEAANAPYDEVAKGRTKHAGDAIWEDRNNDGIINNYDMVFMGYIRPDKTGAIVNTLRWKGLSLRFVMDYAMGHVIDNGWKGYMMGSYRNNCNTVREALTNTWQHAGDGSYYPKFTVQSDADYSYRNYMRSSYSLGNDSGGTNNSAFYRKGDFLAFRELSLSWNISSRFIEKIRLAGLRVGVGVYNIGYLTGYDGLTPEIYNGMDYGKYPRPRQYSFNISLTF